MRRLLIIAGLALAIQALPLSEPTTEAQVISQAPLRPSWFNADLINKQMMRSLPQPGPRPRPTGEPSSEPTASKTSLFSPELIQQHILKGWSLPQLDSGPRPAAVQPDTDSSLSSAHLGDPRELAFPTAPPRSVRAAPRPLPAHKAHGPRAILPYGPYAPRNNVKV